MQTPVKDYFVVKKNFKRAHKKATSFKVADTIWSKLFYTIKIFAIATDCSVVNGSSYASLPAAAPNCAAVLNPA